eukprot:scaffold110_cov315-Pavlova_lutheri.AAC.39
MALQAWQSVVDQGEWTQKLRPNSAKRTILFQAGFPMVDWEVRRALAAIARVGTKAQQLGSIFFNAHCDDKVHSGDFAPPPPRDLDRLSIA